MVSCGNQSYLVRFAHGLLPALVLKMVLPRRWLYTFSSPLYSRQGLLYFLHYRYEAEETQVKSMLQVTTLPSVGRVPERSGGG